jgi:hypothetical protein
MPSYVGKAFVALSVNDVLPRRRNRRAKQSAPSGWTLPTRLADVIGEPSNRPRVVGRYLTRLADVIDEPSNRPRVVGRYQPIITCTIDVCFAKLVARPRDLTRSRNALHCDRGCGEDHPSFDPSLHRIVDLGTEGGFPSRPHQTAFGRNE